ncbi:MAG: hypothetical protein ABIH37_04590 [archaeon]
MPRDISEYPLRLRDASLEKVVALHNLAGEFKESFLTDHELQDLLLRQGYKLEDNERPTSFRQYHTTINAMRACTHLNFLDYFTETMTKPSSIIIPKTKLILLPGEEDVFSIETPEGHDAIGIAELQEEWMENHRAREFVTDFKGRLENALDEYSMQFILMRMCCCRGAFLSYEQAFEEVRELQKRIEKVLDRKSYVVLDNAYYEKGNRLFLLAGEVYGQLLEYPLGRKCVLSKEEERESLAQWRRAHIGFQDEDS